MAESRDRYSTVSIIFHWGLALLVLVQVLLITLHEANEGPAGRQFIVMHKEIGLTILVLTLVRIVWRFMNPPPALPAGTPGWQRIAARGTQVLFYVLLIGLPLGGWAASSAGGRDISYFGLFNWPLLPLPQSRALAGQFMEMHELGVKVLYVLLALHVLGALKHHFVDKDNVARSMIPFLSRR